METELLKLLGGGGSQLILAAGYIPAIWLVKTLWAARDSIQSRLIEMLALKFADAANAKDLWAAQAKVIEDQTRTLVDHGRIVQGLEKRIADLSEELRRARA